MPPGATWWWHWDLGRKPQWQTCPPVALGCPRWEELCGWEQAPGTGLRCDQFLCCCSWDLCPHVYITEVQSLFLRQNPREEQQGGMAASPREWLPENHRTKCVINIRNSWIKTQNILSISPWLPKRSHKCNELSKMIPGSFPLTPDKTSDVPGKHSSCAFRNHSDACVESMNRNGCKSGHTRGELCKCKDCVKHLCSSISQSLRIHPGNKCKGNDKNFDVTCKHQIIHSVGNVATSITHCHTFRSTSESIREKNLTNGRDVMNPLPITRVFNHIRESRRSENKECAKSFH